MLISLRIINFAIVKELELDFSKGMTAFTGETGAGKSIMIDALMLALGGRADSTVIRQGEEICEVTATFSVAEDSDEAQWLALHDIKNAEGEIILRRQLYAEGRSKSSINAQPFPLQKIRELAEHLVHIHGQHQHQTLMQHQTHRQQLDVYAGHDSLLHKLSCCYKQCQRIKEAIEALSRQENNLDKIAFYQFQLEELQALNLGEKEVETLNQEHQILHHAKDYLQEASEALLKLSGDENPTVYSYLHQIIQHLSRLPDENDKVKNAQDLLNSALIHCEEAEDSIQQFLDQIALSPERLQSIEDRLSTLHQMARKYHVDIQQLRAVEQDIVQKLEALKGLDTQLSLLQKDYEDACKAYQLAAFALSESRKTHAKNLCHEISSIIRQLGMPKGEISLAISPLETMQIHGMDKVEYQVCTNPGMPSDSLQKIASGGELSRISLAIQMICAQRGATPTLIFDEVDVGIGGATAALVGQLLRKLGSRLQVFCVTHQPQVAASSHAHFVVEKYTEDEQTYSRIIALNVEDKVNEIARMLSGLAITEQTKLHARELLTQSELMHG